MKGRNRSEEKRKKRFVGSVPAISILRFGMEPVRAQIKHLCAQRMKKPGRAGGGPRLGKGTEEKGKKEEIHVGHLLHQQPA